MSNSTRTQLMEEKILAAMLLKPFDPTIPHAAVYEGKHGIIKSHCPKCLYKHQMLLKTEEVSIIYCPECNTKFLGFI